MQISISYHQQFYPSLLRPRYSDQMFSWFFERSIWSYCESDECCQERCMEIWIFMWICERSGSFFRFNISLNLEQVCENVAYVSVEFLDEFTASTNITSIIRCRIEFFSIMWLFADCTGRGIFITRNFCFIWFQAWFQNGKLHLVLISDPSLSVKEKRFLFDIEWTVNGPRDLNENLLSFLSILLCFFRNSFWPTLILLGTWWRRL